jgi:hypothetical protein
MTPFMQRAATIVRNDQAAQKMEVRTEYVSELKINVSQKRASRAESLSLKISRWFDLSERSPQFSGEFGAEAIAFALKRLVGLFEN